MEEVTKQCKGKCGRVLPLSAFGINNHLRDGHQPMCRECYNEMRRGYERNRTKKRQEAVESTYQKIDGKQPRELIRDVRDVFAKLTKIGYTCQGELKYTQIIKL